MTERQSQVVELRRSGMSGVEIAKMLSISPRTVKMHLRHAAWQMGVKSNHHQKTLAILNALKSPVIDEAKLEKLSRKQQAVVREVIAAKSNREIAAIVGTTEQVVKNCIRSIFDKIGAGSRVELRNMLTL
jgi:DNA-binding CsgD family transcriptional regulator